MRMAVQHSISPQSRLLAIRVNILAQSRCPNVSSVARELPMVEHYDNGSFTSHTGRFEACKFCLQEVELFVTDRVFLALRGDHTGPFEHIAIQADDRDHRRIERKIYPWLRHDAAHQPARIGRGTRFWSAKVAQESF